MARARVHEDDSADRRWATPAMAKRVGRDAGRLAETGDPRLALIGLQRCAGNAAVAGLVRSRRPAPSGRPAVQRLIIGLVGKDELAGKGSTIMHAVASMTGSPLVKDKSPADSMVTYPKAEAADRLTGHGSIGESEALILVAHASSPMNFLLLTIEPRFAGYKGAALAQIVSELLPFKYSGTIYLNGCDTGRRLGYTKPGTSYIEIFGAALAAIREDVGSLVLGSLGGAATISEDTERIDIEKSLYDKLKQKDYSGIAEHDGKYYIYGISGQAYYDMRSSKYSATALDVAFAG
jgi:hypothetical protein